MTYLWKGEQYVAIGAGGHSESGTTIGDSVVAFRLARSGEAPSLWSRTIDRPGGRFMSGAIAVGFAVAADGGVGVALAAEQGGEGVRVDYPIRLSAVLCCHRPA